MSIKDFFYKKEVTLEDQSKLTSSVESSKLIEEIREQNSTFVPDVDFSNPKNFARFGSAKEYYEGSIKRIYQQYPYDGSESEKLSFYNDSTFLDQWLFDNKYPKSTGYGIFSATGWGSSAAQITDYGKPNTLEYIYSAGGLREASLFQHTGSQTISSGKLKDVFNKGVKHDAAENRTLNYRMKMDTGLTIQFWMKKDEFLPSLTKREVILDLWNGVTTSGSHDYGRLLLEMSASDKQESALRLTLYSGSYGIVDQPISLSTYGSSSVANGEWQHHTITVKAASTNLEIDYYNNGILNRANTYGTTVTLGEIPNNINGFLGALQTSSYGDTYHNQSMIGAGKLSASLDDFRFWKKELDAKYIKNTWFYPVGGGANTDDNRTSLGVYYKFNEGVVGNSDYDSVVLDYSGRIANGTWTGYTTSSRNTGSAYVSASILQSEPGDPIIRVDHTDVQSLLTEMATSGSNYDRDNTSRMYDMVPVWLREEDTNNNINYLHQILSSYFDTLYCQIKELPKLKDKNYFSSGSMPYGFVDRMLSEKGFLVPNTFISSDILSTFWQRDDQDNYYEQSIEKTKRQIYYNIYNNLEFILKSKGTEKSFRNLLRCFGVDDEVVKLNVYTDGATHYLKDRYKNSSVKSKFIDFNKPSRFGASVTQTGSVNNSQSFISGSDTARLERNNAFTIEGDVLFPEKMKVEDTGYFISSFITSSVFGFHEADSSDSTDYTFGGSNTANLQFYAVRDYVGSDSAKFVIKNADGTINVESDLFEEVYTNERWNFSLTVEPVGYPFAGSFLSSSNPDYNVRLYGVTYNNEEIKSQFTLTASINNATGISLLTKPKRLYVGANKTNFTGSVIQSTDVKIGSIRMWMDKLSNEAIQQHNLDPKNYGHNKIYGSPTVFLHDISGSTQIPAMDSLILHWNFDENSSSDGSGKFTVEDFSSGSTSNLYGWASNIIERENKGMGIDFPVSEKVFTNEFIFARRKELPEISFTDDKIVIMDNEKEFFIEDEDTTDNIFSLEKSMNQSISEEMIRTFSTMKEYANLFAKPVDYYRQDYKRLRKARSLFFERTTGNPDFDKFTEYFKWIDTSVSFFMEQLKPASVTFTEGVANVVESHIFERPKNDRKFPTVKTLTSTMGSMRGIGELDYNWKFGHSPEYKGDLYGQRIRFNTRISSSLSDGNLLKITGSVGASTVDKQFEIDTAHATALTASVPGLTDTDHIVNTYRKAFKAIAGSNAVSTDASHTGIGANDFSVSFWVNNITADNNSKATINFYDGVNIHHRINFQYGNTRVHLSNSAGTEDFAVFATELHSTNKNNWMHYAVTFPVSSLASGVPKLFSNGSELSQTGYAAIGGSTPTIDKIVIQLDDHYAIQDVAIWNTLLTGSAAVTELYNGGIWKDPTTHTSASAIVDYYKFGEEDYWNTYGVKIGQTIDNIEGSIDSVISSSFGTGENHLTITATNDAQFQFIQGKGEKSSTEIWNSISSSLSYHYTDWTTSYTSNATNASFSITKDNNDAVAIAASTTGTSFGLASVVDKIDENSHCLWRKEREKRTDITERETIRKIIGSKTTGFVKRLGDPTTSPQTAYIAEGYAEAVRRFSKPYKLSAEAATTIHGGTNYNENRNRDFIYDSIKPHGGKTSAGIPVNVVVVGVGTGQGLISSVICNDEEIPNQKSKFDFRLTVGKDTSGDGASPATASLDLVYEVKSAYGSPFNMVSGSISDGANKKVADSYSTSVVLTNLHSDTTYMSNDIPMQGPFTNTWVGGRQNRHIVINRFDTTKTTEGGGATNNNLDDNYSRPEAFRILLGEHPDEDVQDGALGIVGPDYGGPYPDPSRKWAIYYRGFRGKRPYNFQNIQGDQYRQGNYTRKYEYFNTVGRTENNLRFKKMADTWTYLATEVKSNLPETTNQIGMFAVEATIDGNIASGFDSNRHNETNQSAAGKFAAALAASYVPPNHAFTGITASIGGVSTETQLEITTTQNAAAAATDVSASLFSTYRNRFFAVGNNANSFLMQGSVVNGLSGSFSLSFFYQAKENTTTVNRFELDEGSHTRLMIYHDVTSNDQWNVVFYDTVGGNGDVFKFTTGTTTPNTIHHIVFVIDEDVANVSPKLYIDGNEISLVTTPITTHPILDIDKIQSIRFSDDSFLQDLVFWEKKLTEDDAQSLVDLKQTLAAWSWKDPSTHVSASYINNWWKIGYEDYLDGILNVGDNLKDYSSGDITISSSYSGTGNGIDLTLRTGAATYDTLYTTGGVGTAKSGLEIVQEVETKMQSRFYDYIYNRNSGTFGAPTKTQYFMQFTASSIFNDDLSIQSNVTDNVGSREFAIDPVIDPKHRNIVQVESDFITGSTRNKTVITSRFSAPGGVEVQTYGYLDAYAREYSVHNNLNYRNLSIRGSGSGESGTIRVNSHANTRDGLRTLYQRPMGRGGVDSVYEVVDETDYNLTASFHKIPRNTLVTPRSGSSAVEIVERSNNYNYQSTIPASDYNYSWVTSSLGDNYNVRSGTQKVFGYWPKDGLNKVNGVFDSAITFPTASEY